MSFEAKANNVGSEVLVAIPRDLSVTVHLAVLGQSRIKVVEYVGERLVDTCCS